MVSAKEYTFKLVDEKWLISTPNFPVQISTLICPSSYKTIPVQTPAVVTLTSGCSLPLNSITIEPDINSVDNEFKTKHYKWF